MYDIYEEGRSALDGLASWYEDRVGDRNEATTRLHLIDSLFFDCLAWSKDDVIAEESHNGRYADYCFTVPRRILIVEAKREGQYFELPAGMSRLEHSLNSIARDNPPLEAALKQVADYCQHRGVPIGVVCNGHQLVGFVATRNDGIPPMEGRGLVFTPEQVDAAIARAERHKLIESPSRSRVPVDQPMPSALRATTIGAYHARRLCRHFAYTDAIVVDTPVFSSEARDQIRDVHTIRERLSRVEAFRRILGSAMERP